jgi:MinD-like ATPase involved in chromosome partitioning or flagellar assembly
MLLDLDTHAPALNQLLPLGEASAGLAGAARLIRQGRFNTEQLDRLSANIKHGRTNFKLLPGLPISSRWPEVTPDTVRQLVSICSQNFDVVIADVASDLEDSLTKPDTPTNRNAATRAALEISTQVIVCLAGSQLSISRYLNDFAALNELQKTRRLIINRSEPKQQLATAIRSLTKERIDAVIPNDEPALELAESQKLPLALARRKSPARNAIAALAHKLLAWAP